jgi:DTW domain-containing protein
LNLPSFREMPNGIRGYRTSRCARCWMESRLCICSLVQPIRTNTRVVIVMHWKESGRSSNTGRLANLVLENSEVRFRGVPAQEPFDSEGLVQPDGRTLVLFPGDGAATLTPEHGQPGQGPLTLVVPDGTWRQARRARRHEPALAGLDKVQLPGGSLTKYRLRKAPDNGFLSTYESIACALGILEGARVESLMMPPFEAMVRRTLRTRGKKA